MPKAKSHVIPFHRAMSLNYRRAGQGRGLNHENGAGLPQGKGGGSQRPRRGEKIFVLLLLIMNESFTEHSNAG